MKPALILFLLILSPIAFAMPNEARIVIEKKGDTSSYALEGSISSDLDAFLKLVSKSMDLLNNERPIDSLTIILVIKGNVDLSEIQRIRTLLSQYGFDHFTFCSPEEYKCEAMIIITNGKPDDGYLHGRPKMKEEKPKVIVNGKPLD